ncbi:transmembrane protein 104 homolog [Periplaneta americana]|uniref:transmembrane protein 104 homolog n=1 Tax=Periplaneta americana TaxID=6978 RepID=UPI0037E983EE
MPDISVNRISSGQPYSTWTGLIYVFNLIVGTGALTLPAVFDRAGWALGLSLICVLAVISYITVTFVIETMASANAIVQWKRLQQMKRALQAESLDEDSAEDTPLFSPDSVERFPPQSHRYYVIQEKIEMGQMASLFFNRLGRSLFFICIVIYLYGDLSIYAAAVAKSLMEVACSYNSSSTSILQPDTDVCWEDVDLTRIGAYRMFLGVFLATLGPFAFFDVQKTKYLQMFSTILRQLAFAIMIITAIRDLIVDGPKGHPQAADVMGVPELFGACVYSFMCHHSLPALVSPIADKSRLFSSLALDYLLIAMFYLLLSLTGVFAFAQVSDLYTLDFSQRWQGNKAFIVPRYFLALFPVFTLSTSFPIVAITLRNNLKSLFLTEGRHYRWCFRKVFFPLMAVIPPVLVAMATKNLEILVGVTGSYAGAGIQYLIPAFLVLNARKRTLEVIGMGVKNDFESPFKGKGWVIFVVIWAVACIILVSVNFIKSFLW